MHYEIQTNEIFILDENNEKIAFIKFPNVSDNVVNITTTYVSDVLRGQGIAGKLINLVYDEVKRTNRYVIPTCSYAVNWFNKNLDKQDVLWQD